MCVRACVRACVRVCVCAYLDVGGRCDIFKVCLLGCERCLGCGWRGGGR